MSDHRSRSRRRRPAHRSRRQRDLPAPWQLSSSRPRGKIGRRGLDSSARRPARSRLPLRGARLQRQRDPDRPSSPPSFARPQGSPGTPEPRADPKEPSRTGSPTGPPRGLNWRPQAWERWLSRSVPDWPPLEGAEDLGCRQRQGWRRVPGSPQRDRRPDAVSGTRSQPTARASLKEPLA